MAHVVCDACIGCKRTDCVDVCPVDCFHEGPNFVVIDPTTNALTAPYASPSRALKPPFLRKEDSSGRSAGIHRTEYEN